MSFILIVKRLNMLLKITLYNVYNVKKGSDSIQIDLKKLKEEFIHNFNERAKIRSIVIAKIKTYDFKRRMRTYAIIKKHVGACTSTDDLIVKKYVDAYACTNYVCTNENEPCTNENEPCTNEKEPCTNENESCTNENEPYTNENEPCTSDDDGDDDDDDDDDDYDNSDIGKLRNFSDKVLNKLINVSETRKEILINIKKILAIIDKGNNMSKNDLKYKKLNIFLMIS